jgi:hypothetical protein
MGNLQSSRFDANLARPLEELVRLWPTGILQMTVDQQAELADSVCVRNAKDRGFCESQIVSLRADFPRVPPTNTTGVANIAYMSKHAHPDFRKEFEAVYLAYTLLLLRRNNMTP